MPLRVEPLLGLPVGTAWLTHGALRKLDTEPHQVASLLRSIRDEFPALDWSRHTVLDQGWEHRVVVLDNAIVFRFPKQPAYPRLLPGEVEFLDYLAPRVRVAVPRYEYVFDDVSAAGYRAVPGRGLEPVRFAALHARDRETVVEQLAEFLTTLHTIKDARAVR